MKQRIITGLILAALALSVIYIGQTALTVGLLLVSLLGVYEIVKICHRPDWSYIVDVYCLAMSVWLFLGTQDFFIPAWQEMLFLIGLFTLVVLLEQFKIEDSYLIFTMMIFVLTALRGIAHIRASLGLGAIFFLLFATYGCDTGAYFTGYLIGKHPLIPRLSPKKTVEGSLGGMILGTLFGVGIAYFFPFGLTLGKATILAFLLTVTSQIGDLTFSALKRHYQIKDFSNLLPGHGGDLDRIDSLVFNVIVFSVFYTLFL